MARFPLLLAAILPLLSADALASHGGKEKSFFLGLAPGGLAVGYQSRKASFSVLAGLHEPAGHFETRPRRIWVPARTETIYVPARYERRWVGGCLVDVLVEPAHYETICHPGYFRTEYVRVWVPAFRRGFSRY